ncbi:MAG: 4-hydroxy-tetrahydrodipicolinate reductase, partial [Gemmatimonadota bacterium]
HAAVLTAANFSIGVNLLLSLCEEVGGALDASAWDVEITEAHHARKVDAPSGTAIALGQAVARGRGVELAAVRRDGRSGHVGARSSGEIGMHSLRGGNVVGEHTVTFFGARERIELSHAATDRAVFAEGALAAAHWLAGRAPGRYAMRDVLNL